MPLVGRALRSSGLVAPGRAAGDGQVIGDEYKKKNPTETFLSFRNPDRGHQHKRFVKKLAVAYVQATCIYNEAHLRLYTVIDMGIAITLAPFASCRSPVADANPNDVTRDRRTNCGRKPARQREIEVLSKRPMQSLNAPCSLPPQHAAIRCEQVPLILNSGGCRRQQSIPHRAVVAFVRY
jgi:hypothetical protein